MDLGLCTRMISDVLRILPGHIQRFQDPPVTLRRRRMSPGSRKDWESATSRVDPRRVSRGYSMGRCMHVGAAAACAWGADGDLTSFSREPHGHRNRQGTSGG